MYYTAELRYMTRVLEQMRLQIMQIDRSSTGNCVFDLGIRGFLGQDEVYRHFSVEALCRAEENTIYKLTDIFRCKYILLLLPGALDAVPLLIGPYMTFEMAREELLEEAERFGVPAGGISQFEEFFANIPIFSNEMGLMTLINTFGEVLWGSGKAFKVVDINREAAETPVSFVAPDGEQRPEEILLHMQFMEKRYNYENELMRLVSQGLAHRAELMLSNFSKMVFEQRSADPIRNIKNYSIICNTLLRKAAEQGGVHPIYLDKVSSDFAKRIEKISGEESGQEIMNEMAHSYCTLVRKHAVRQYSALVQRVSAYIDTDLTNDLSLSSLASVLNVNASYLSALFRKETGKTVTEYVNEKRMENAGRLLRTTRLQIQTVSQHCGISDVNYFSKIFKKFYGTSPKQYREGSRVYLQRKEK